LTRNSWFGYKEGARTLPRPTRHAYTQENNLTNEIRAVAGQQSMNQWTDQLIAQYFDENNVPYTNTIAFYSKFCVSQGYTTEENKLRLKDLCFYAINHIIPSLPSTTNPVSSIVLPPIEFNSINFNNVYSYNASGLANLDTNYWKNNQGPSFYGNFPGFNFSGFPESSDASGSSISGSSGTGGTSGSSGAGGNTGSANSCGSCPTSCLSNMLNSVNGISSGTAGSGGLNGYGTYDASLAQQYGVSYVSPDSIYNLAIQSISPYSYIGTGGYMITDLSNLYLNPNIQNSPLNNNILGLFETYFGISASDISNGSISADRIYTPTPELLNTLDFFAKHYLPIDDDHKNKLRDLAFYLMEEIIKGLPTNPEHPYSYVEWKPIRWLSHYSS
jgi:hypothetical protein